MARVVFFEDAGGEHRWRMVADNGRIIATSAEGYDSRSNARRGWNKVEMSVISGVAVEEEAQP